MGRAVPEKCTRIAAIIRLLSSDVPGEVVSAAEALGRALRSAGFDWHDLADVAERHLGKPMEASEWQRIAHDCLRRGGTEFSIKERAFLENIARWRGRPSDSQIDWLQRLAAEIRVTA